MGAGSGVAEIVQELRQVGGFRQPGQAPTLLESVQIGQHEPWHLVLGAGYEDISAVQIAMDYSGGMYACYQVSQIDRRASDRLDAARSIGELLIAPLVSWEGVFHGESRVPFGLSRRSSQWLGCFNVCGSQEFGEVYFSCGVADPEHSGYAMEE